MNKTAIKIAWLILMLSALTLTACGSDTPTAVSVATTAPATTAAATTAAVTTVPAATTAAVTTATAATPITATTAAANSKPLRNLRYCEVLPVYQESGKLVQYVYNTQGLNDCPADAWNALNADDLAKSLGAVKVVLNGPRYWVMDQINASGDSASGEIKTFGSLKMQLRAKVEIPVGTTGANTTPYSQNIINRNTEYVFLKGKPTYQLVSPEGDVYVMQTYSQIIDPKLTMEDLSNLGARLKLPTGWQYQVVIPDQDLHLVAKGTAFLIQDDLTNSYQKVIK